MAKRRVFLDLDYTLYDTDAMIRLVRADMETLGVERGEIDRAQAIATREGYSFFRHLKLLRLPATTIRERNRTYRQLLATGDRFLLPHVHEGLKRLQEDSELHLLTYGRPSYQRCKVRGIGCLRDVFTSEHYIWRYLTKGDVIRRYGNECPTFFLDDVSTHLEDVYRKAPLVTRVRMEWPHFPNTPHRLDEVAWQVVHSFETFVAIVKGKTS